MTTIKVVDIRVGDTIRTSTTIDGIKTTKELRVSKVGDLGAVASFETEEFGEVFLSWVSDVELVDRPAPKLPTKPGRLIYVEEFDGNVLTPPILAFLDIFGFWQGERRFPGGPDHARSRLITKWSPATVTKATP
ncbi:MAG: hypothetical protein IIZ13_08110 [Renibacterium sp.]|nr:hypothetical protein [Renibacterium sp.]